MTIKEEILAAKTQAWTESLSEILSSVGEKLDSLTTNIDVAGTHIWDTRKPRSEEEEKAIRELAVAFHDLAFGVGAAAKSVANGLQKMNEARDVFEKAAGEAVEEIEARRL